MIIKQRTVKKKIFFSYYFSMASKVIGKCEKNFIIRCLRERQVTKKKKNLFK
jgi:hypothetical protein